MRNPFCFQQLRLNLACHNMHTVTLARNAMATRFEIVLQGSDPRMLQSAGEAALDEIERLEARLSLYRPTSEIAHVNARASHESVRVTPEVFRLLQQAQNLSNETDGLFDITIGPLVRCWGFMGGTGHMPDPLQLERARERAGMALVNLNADDSTVTFTREGVLLDLGAIGKGYALEQAADILRDCGVESALIHGGTSTVYGLGHPADAAEWRVAIHEPRDSGQSESPALCSIGLVDSALSVSAVWGRSFQEGEIHFGHVIDPRTGKPVTGVLIGAVAVKSATESDAFSTALLTGGAARFERLTLLRPEMRAVLVTGTAESWEVHTWHLELARSRSKAGVTLS